MKAYTKKGEGKLSLPNIIIPIVIALLYAIFIATGVVYEIPMIMNIFFGFMETLLIFGLITSFLIGSKHIVILKKVERDNYNGKDIIELTFEEDCYDGDGIEFKCYIIDDGNSENFDINKEYTISLNEINFKIKKFWPVTKKDKKDEEISEKSSYIVMIIIFLLAASPFVGSFIAMLIYMIKNFKEMNNVELIIYWFIVVFLGCITGYIGYIFYNGILKKDE